MEATLPPNTTATLLLPPNFPVAPTTPHHPPPPALLLSSPSSYPPSPLPLTAYPLPAPSHVTQQPPTTRHPTEHVSTTTPLPSHVVSSTPQKLLVLPDSTQTLPVGPKEDFWVSVRAVDLFGNTLPQRFFAEMRMTRSRQAGDRSATLEKQCGYATPEERAHGCSAHLYHKQTAFEGSNIVFEANLFAFPGSYNFTAVLRPRNSRPKHIAAPLTLAPTTRGRVVHSANISVTMRPCGFGERLSGDGITCVKCEIGHYSFQATATIKCMDCPKGGYCPGGGLLIPVDGYAHTNHASPRMLLCPNPIACSYPKRQDIL